MIFLKIDQFLTLPQRIKISKEFKLQEKISS